MNTTVRERRSCEIPISYIGPGTLEKLSTARDVTALKPRGNTYLVYKRPIRSGYYLGNIQHPGRRLERAHATAIVSYAYQHA